MSRQVNVGLRCGPEKFVLTRDFIARFSEAVNDPTPECRSGAVAPVLATAPLIGRVFGASRLQSMDRDLPGTTGNVHGSHDVHLMRSLAADVYVVTSSEIVGATRSPVGTVVTHRITVEDAEGVCAVHDWNTLYIGGQIDHEVGEAPQDHSLPVDAREQGPLETIEVHVDADAASRYAALTGGGVHGRGDGTGIGESDTPFLNGLNTLAICAGPLVAEIADGDPRRVSRVAGRFAAPVYVGSDLRLEVYQISSSAYGFEALLGTDIAVKNGRLELAAAPL
jgi:acyl dehydratase